MVSRKPGKPVTVWMETALIERVTALATKANTTRSKIIVQMVELTTRSLEKADSLNVLSMALLVKDMEVMLKAWIDQIQTEGSDLKEIHKEELWAD